MPRDVLPPARTFDRIPGKIPITILIQSRPKSITMPGSTVDLSKIGLRIEARQSLRPGQTLDVFSKGGRWRLGHCKVVWVRSRASDGALEAGLKILN